MTESKMTECKNSLRINSGTCSVRYNSASRIMFHIGIFTSLIFFFPISRNITMDHSVSQLFPMVLRGNLIKCFWINFEGSLYHHINTAKS